MILFVLTLLAGVNIIDNGKNRGQVDTLSCVNGVTCRVNTHGWVEVATTSDGGTVVIPNCAAGSVATGNGTTLSCTSTITSATTATTATTATSAATATTATALASNPADCSAGQYANTIAANGDLTCSAVSYSQLSGSPIAGGSSPQMQYNNSGVLGGTTKAVSNDGAHIDLVHESSMPSAPSTDTRTANYWPASGFPGQILQVDPAMTSPLPLSANVGDIQMFFHTNGFQYNCLYYNLGDRGATAYVAQGSAAALGNGGGSTTSVNWDAGSWVGRQLSTTKTISTANSFAGWEDPNKHAWRGNTALSGGFWYKSRQCIGTQAPSRVFIGFSSAGGITANAAPYTSTSEASSCTDCVYVGADGPDTNLSLCTNDNGGTASCTTLGSNFPKTSGCYDITFTAPPNGSDIHMAIDRLDSAANTTGSVNTNLPGNYVPLQYNSVVENTDGGTAVALQLMGIVECFGL